MWILQKLANAFYLPYTPPYVTDTDPVKNMIIPDNQDDNQTYSEVDSENESTSYMYGFLVIPTLMIVIFVSRYFR